MDKLQGLEAYYRTLFEENPIPMWIFDIETFAFLAVIRFSFDENPAIDLGIHE